MTDNKASRLLASCGVLTFFVFTAFFIVAFAIVLAISTALKLVN